MDVETGVFHSLIHRLSDLREEMHGQPKNIRIDLNYISNELAEVSAILADESRRVRSDEQERGWSDEQVQQFKHEVRKTSYYIEISIDKLRQIPNPTLEGFKGLMENMGGFLKKGKTSHHIFASELKRIKAELQILAEFRASLRFDSVDRPAALQDLYPEMKDLVGIHGKKDEELIKLLSDGDKASNKNLKRVCVVGFAGLGKTTLVKAVYAKIGGGFDCKAFVVAGRYPNKRTVLMDIISQLTMNNSYSNTCTLNGQELTKKLQDVLENKRYLIVIDDMWNEKACELVRCFSSIMAKSGSRIITTTRKVMISNVCCSSIYDSVYQMEPLSHDDSKKLLYNRMFGSVSGYPHEYEQVSSDILKKCDGVPLAIIAMASVLAGDPWMKLKPKADWHVLIKSIGREVTNECWNNMQIILSFSYYDLPLHLKTCLLYMSCHPFERDRLVKKLIAEEIVSQKFNSDGPSLGEEEASMYLDVLVGRNVIHPLECNSTGEVITYHIHPMMHDILKAIAIEENFAATLDVRDISSAHCMNCSNLFIDCPESENLNDLSSMAFDGGVRSLTIFGHANRILLRHFESTRVLDLEGCKSIERADLDYICTMVLLKRLCLAKTQITELPPQIGNLQYLDGLDVGGTQITELPPQIGNLKFLKRLDATKTHIKEIPSHVLRLTRLVTLLIGDNESSEGVKIPDGIGKMTSLQQLYTIDLRKCSVSSLKELLELPHLNNIAVVSGDEPEDTRINDALLSSLRSTMIGAGGLKIFVHSDFRLGTLDLPMYCTIFPKKLTVVRRSLGFPTRLPRQSFPDIYMLDIRVCKLDEDDMKILRELPRLQSLIVRLEVLPTKMIRISCEGFAKLYSFYVDCRMPRVIFEEGAMPKLEHLELKLYGGTASEEHMGIKNLLNLRKVTLRYAKWYATNKGVRETTEAVKTECKEHQNKITLCVAEDDKDGDCIRKTEIFQENRVVSCSRMTEIGKEDIEDTKEGGLHQSSHDIASCSEIEEVVG